MAQSAEMAVDAAESTAPAAGAPPREVDLARVTDPVELRARLEELDQIWEETWSGEPGGPPTPESILRLTRFMKLVFWVLPALGLLAVGFPLVLGAPWYFGLPGVALFLVSLVMSIVLARRLRTYQDILQSFEALRAALRLRLDQLERLER